MLHKTSLALLKSYERRGNAAFNGGDSKVSQDFIVVLANLLLSLWLNKNLCSSELCIGGEVQVFSLYCSGLANRAAGGYQNCLTKHREEIWERCSWVTVDCCSKLSLLYGF